MGSMSGVLRRWSRQYWHERVMLSMMRRDETLLAVGFGALSGEVRARKLLRRVAEMGFAGKARLQLPRNPNPNPHPNPYLAQPQRRAVRRQPPPPLQPLLLQPRLGLGLGLGLG